MVHQRPVNAGDARREYPGLPAEDASTQAIRQHARDRAQKGLDNITKLLTRSVSKGKLEEDEKHVILGRIRLSTKLEDMAETDFVVEAATENETLKFNSCCFCYR